MKAKPRNHQIHEDENGDEAETNLPRKFDNAYLISTKTQSGI